MRQAQVCEPLGLYPVTLYLDQSDISDLAFNRKDTTAAHRSRLRMLTARGDVRLRVSIAHFIESPKLSFRRLGAIHRLLAEIPHTVYARSYPADILRAELTGKHVDLRDHPVTALGIREVLRIACAVGVVGPFAEQIAYAKNQMKTILRTFNCLPPMSSPKMRTMAMPAHALQDALDSAIERGIRRGMLRSDVLDVMHLYYAAHSDVATVDGFVFEVTRKVRRLGNRTRWFRSSSMGDVLDHLEECRRRTV